MTDENKYKFDGTEKFHIAKFNTADTGGLQKNDELKNQFNENLKKINELQQALYAERQEGLIFIFQAMDAAGKDGVIRTVFSTLSPHGVKEFCFKVPSREEMDHDFLWRFWQALPAKGNISIFNRSYYESVLVEKVHEIWKNQRLPERCRKTDIIEQRYRQIVHFERYLYCTGTRIVKIFLNVSKEEQASRFLSRMETPQKNWKLSANDIAERKHWDDYMAAFEKMIRRTAQKESPWFVVPADRKWYARYLVSQIVLETLKDIGPRYPTVSKEEREQIAKLKEELKLE